jgi:transposase
MGTNYNRGLIKQIEELTLENERLIDENKKLRTENKELRDQMAEMKTAMELTIGKLLEEIARLKAQTNKNSGNSSKPPSQDGFKRVPNSREATGRKSGGQPGHAGKRLELPRNLDELVEKGYARRELEDHTNGADTYVSRYTLDIDIALVVTEHRYAKGAAPMGAEVTYGKKIKVLTAMLSTEGIIAEERLCDFFNEITRGAIKLSEATVERFLAELSENLGPELETIETSLLNGPVQNTDDTPVRCAQKPDYGGVEPVLRKPEQGSFNAYIRTYSNPTATRYTANPQKDNEGVVRDAILRRYVGILSHDHDAKFYNYGTAHATCGAHLLRELRGMFELQKIPWAEEMRQFMKSINDCKNDDINSGETSANAETLSKIDRDYDLLIDKGRAALSRLKDNELGFNELRCMLNRLTEYKDCYLLFIRDYYAPFTNNLAERDLRIWKTKQKVSGCFRSWAGIQRYTRIRSFISTAKKRKLSLFHSISRAFRGLPVLEVGE